jgi:lysophospholipase L1-like esterase
MLDIATKLVLSPVLIAQGLYLRQTMPVLPEAEGDRSGVCSHVRHTKGSIRLIVVGDSSGAGVGVKHQHQALAQPLAEALSHGLHRAVQWQLVAQSGWSTRAATQALLHLDPAPRADIAVTVLGVNDVLEQVPTHRAIEDRKALVQCLMARCGVQHVAMFALPPMHEFPGLPQPLRTVFGADAKRINRAQLDWAESTPHVSHCETGVHLEHSNMSSDGFHPGLPVYRACVMAMAEHLMHKVLPGLGV